MAMSISTIHCLNCDENKDIYECKGCSQTFCFLHLTNHREDINQDLNQFQHDCNLFKEKFIDQKNNIKNYSLIQQIDQWEEESIDKIKQTAHQCRVRIINYVNNIEKNLNQLFEQSKQVQKENKLNEILLNELIRKLVRLKEDLDEPSNISIQQQTTSSFIDQIYINKEVSKGNYEGFILKSLFNLHLDDKWIQNGLTIVGGNENKNQLDLLNAPRGIFIDDIQNIYIADYENHRIIEWNSNTQNARIVAGGNGPGQQTNQLNYPTDIFVDKQTNSIVIADFGNRRVILWSLQNNTTDGQILIKDIDCYGLAMDKNRSLYVSDSVKHQVRRWKRGEPNGTVVAGGNSLGDQLNQFNFPTFIFVDENYSLYVSDKNNHRVMKWEEDDEEGIIVAGGNDEGDSLNQLSEPRGVIVDQLGQIYVADGKNGRVMCWCEEDDEGRIVVSGNRREKRSNQLSYPSGISFDVEGNLYVVDQKNGRIEKFELDLN